jgi:hypothetical protein
MPPNDYFYRPREVQKYEVGVNDFFDPNFEEFYGVPNARIIGKEAIGKGRKFKPTMMPKDKPAENFYPMRKGDNHFRNIWMP